MPLPNAIAFPESLIANADALRQTDALGFVNAIVALANARNLPLTAAMVTGRKYHVVRYQGYIGIAKGLSDATAAVTAAATP